MSGKMAKPNEEVQQALLKSCEEILTKMDMIQIAEYQDMTGNAFIWRAKQLLAVTEMEQGRLGESRNRMENVLSDMRKYYETQLHPAME